MELIYDQISKWLEDNLTSDNLSYTVVYNNNNMDREGEKEEALKSLNENYPISGVLRVDNSETQNAGGIQSRLEHCHVSFVMENKTSIVNEVSAALNMLCNNESYNNIEFVYDSKNSCQVKFYYRSDGAQFDITIGKETKEVIAMELFFDLFIYGTMVSSVDRVFKINGKDLIGITNTTYVLNKTMEGATYGTDPQQKGDLTNKAHSIKVDLFVLMDNPVLKKLLSEEEDSLNYTIVYGNGIKTRSLKMQIQNVTEICATGGVFNGSISFVDGSDHYDYATWVDIE